MSFERRVRDHLESVTTELQAPDRLEEVMAEGRRRQAWRRTSTALGAAAVVAAVVLVAQALMTGPPNATVATQAPPTTLAAEPGRSFDQARGVLAADTDGIRVLGADGATEVTLSAGQGSGGVVAAYPDQRGGIVFQFEVTPPPWPESSVMRLAAGAARPEVLVEAPAGHRLTSVGPAIGSRGQDLFVFLEDTPDAVQPITRIETIDLDSGLTRTVGTLEDGSTVTAGGSLLGVVDRSGACPTLDIFDLTLQPVDAHGVQGCIGSASSVAIGADGKTLGLLDQGRLRILSLETGEEVERFDAPEATTVTSGPGGWAVSGPQQVILIAAGVDPVHLPPSEGTVIPYGQAFELARDASLSPGAASLPCRPSPDLTLADQGLPNPVAMTRETIFQAASTCDYQALATLAADDGTTITFGEARDPVQIWVEAGRQGSEPLGVLARLLNTAPRQDPAVGLWVWPAVQVDPTDQSSWDELAAIFGQTEIDQMKSAPDGYLGYRVGISTAGTWGYFVAGD